MPSIFGSGGLDASRSAKVPWLDRLAIGASFACLVHCLFLPLLVAAAPALSRALEFPEALHLYTFVAAIPISAMAMRQGYRHHGLILPAGLGLLGLTSLGVGALAGMEAVLETGFTLAGSVLLAAAHIRNWQLRLTSLSTAAPAPGA